MSDNGLSAQVVKSLLDLFPPVLKTLAVRKNMRETALDIFVQDIKNSNLNAEMKAVCIAMAEERLNELIHQKKVVDYAFAALRESARPQDVEPDWMAQLLDRVRLVSDEQFQIIWGKILAEECNQPGSMPKQLLSILSQMDRADAEAFVRVCSVTIELQMADGAVEYRPMVFSSGSGGDTDGPSFDYEGEIGLNDRQLANLNALGLVRYQVGDFGLTNYGGSATALYFGERYNVTGTTLLMGTTEFTRAGTALYRVVEKKERKGFLSEVCVPHWEWYWKLERQVQQSQQDLRRTVDNMLARSRTGNT